MKGRGYAEDDGGKVYDTSRQRIPKGKKIIREWREELRMIDSVDEVTGYPVRKAIRVK